MTERAPFGDLILDITGVSHLFGGEAAMLRSLLSRLRVLGYTVAGAIAPTIGAAWAVSHFARSQIIELSALEQALDGLPVACLRLDEAQLAGLGQMGLKTVGQLRGQARKPLQARFGASLLIRIDQAYGHIQERMKPRLPPVEHFVERRFADPIALIDDVLMTAHDLAVKLSCQLEIEGLGAQAFHLFLYRVDHKVMSLSINASRLTRDYRHVSDMFRHKAQRLEGEYDAGFGIDMVRLAASSLDRLDASQIGAFSIESSAEDVDQLTDRLSSRLGAFAVLRPELVRSRLPERAARLAPTLAGHLPPIAVPNLVRPLRLLPVPEPIAINAEVPNGLPASMVWRRQSYRLIKGEGPERLGAEWWRTEQRLELVEPKEVKPPKKPPYIPKLPLFDPDGATRDYYVVEDTEGRRFWVYRQGFYGGEVHPGWYLHGLFP
jgi:protein ImuB